MAERGESYTCAVCGGTFTAGWSDDEAQAELQTNFPGMTTDKCDLVCDDCFKTMDVRPMAREDVAREQAVYESGFAAGLRRLVRADRRGRLRRALTGTWEDRWHYAFAREATKAQQELILWGSAVTDPRSGALRILHNYRRLTRLAERWANQRSDP